MHLREQAAEQETLLRVQGLKKVFRSGESDLVLFENLSFEVKRGEMLAIVGESGAGVSQSRGGLRLAISLSAAGIHGGGKRGDAAAGARAYLGRGGAGSFTLAA